MIHRGDPPKLRAQPWGVPRALAHALDAKDFPTREQVSGLAASLGGLLAASTVAPAAAATTGASLTAWLSPLVVKVAISIAIGAGVGAVICGTSVYIRARPVDAPAAMVRATSSDPAATPVVRAPIAFSQPPASLVLASPPAAVPSEGVRPTARPVRLPVRSVERPTETPRAEIEPSEPTRPLCEIDLIDRAERAAATRPDQAKKWLEEHERRFPDGAFAQERELIAIEVAARAGAVSEARSRAEQFYRRFAGTPYRARVEGILRGAGGS